MFFTGAHYQSNSSVVKTLYRYYKGLQACDITMGVFCIVFVALEIIACVMLHQRKKGGPTIVIVLYSIVLVINIAYPIVVSLITKVKFEQLISVSVIVSVIVSIVMIIVNAIYYSRRKHIFVR